MKNSMKSNLFAIFMVQNAIVCWVSNEKYDYTCRLEKKL